MKQRNLKHYIVIFYGRLELAKKNGGQYEENRKEVSINTCNGNDINIFTSCGGKKSDVGGLGDDNKVNNIFNQGKIKIRIIIQWWL